MCSAYADRALKHYVSAAALLLGMEHKCCCAAPWHGAEVWYSTNAPTLTACIPVLPFLLQSVVQQQQQQQHVLQRWRLPVAVQPLAELAGFFDNADPTDPFTLYGTNL
jgi:hypothetical protein